MSATASAAFTLTLRLQAAMSAVRLRCARYSPNSHASPLSSTATQTPVRPPGVVSLDDWPRSPCTGAVLADMGSSDQRPLKGE
jgi:hypothetical protein